MGRHHGDPSGFCRYGCSNRDLLRAVFGMTGRGGLIGATTPLTVGDA